MSNRFSYGGQAVIEGVMMRGRHSLAIAVRRPSGDIVVSENAIGGFSSDVFLFEMAIDSRRRGLGRGARDRHESPQFLG